MTNTTSARAADFVDTVGVNTHLRYTDGGYVNTTNVASELRYLGIDQVRDSISEGSLKSFIALAQQGIKFTIGLVASTVTDTATLNARLSLVARLVAAVPGSVVAVEGANEVNNWPVTYNGLTGLQGALAMQRDIYAGVHGNPALQGVAVDYFTGYGAGTIAAGPDPSKTAGLADFDTQHPYPNQGQAPAAWVAPNKAASNETPGQIGPLVYTETGYSSNGGTNGAVDGVVQAKYTLDLLLDTMKSGVHKTYLYELMDAYAKGSPQGNDGYGLFNTDGSPKLVASSLHNMTAILADTDANARTFATNAVQPTVTGLPATGQSLVLQKASGESDIVVWAEPKIWNKATGTEVAAAASAVTLDLGATYTDVSVYDPLVGTAPVATLHGVSRVQLSLLDHPLIVSVGPERAAPTVAITAQVLTSDTGISASDGITSNGGVVLSGSLQGASGTIVQVWDGATDLGTATMGDAGRWSFATTLADGGHALRALAVDPSGRSGASAAAAAITVANAAPVIALTAQSLAADGTTETLAGTVTGGVGTTVAIYDGSHALGAATLDGHGGWSFQTTLSPGQYAWKAVATDVAGNAASAASSFAVPAATDTLVLAMSEDAYRGDAQFVASVDGVQVGGVRTITALHGVGQSQAFTLNGAFGTGSHTVGIAFLNDSYGGVGRDRNLYVKSMTLDGTTTTFDAVQTNNGLKAYQLSTPVRAPDVLTVNLSEDAYRGNAAFTVSVDGKLVAASHAVTALHQAGQSQAFTMTGYFGTGMHNVAVAFLNDAYGGSKTADRNLYVDSITLDGKTSEVKGSQQWQGSVVYKVAGATVQPPTTPVVSIGAGATLILDKEAGAGAAVTFDGAAGTAEFTDAASFHGSIAGFAKGDTLDLRSIGFRAGATTLSYDDHGQAGTLSVSDGTHSASLALSGRYAASAFHLASDGQSGTAISLS